MTKEEKKPKKKAEKKIKEKKKPKAKKPKDKDAPKKPLSAFFLYQAKRRPEINANENKDNKLANKDIVRVRYLPMTTSSTFFITAPRYKN